MPLSSGHRLAIVLGATSLVALAVLACSAHAGGAAARADPVMLATAHGATAAAMAIGASAARIGASDPYRGRCPKNMAEIDGRFCIDRWEASLVDLETTGEQPHSPFTPVDGHKSRAVSEPGVFPQGYISAIEARRACEASGKRLCKVPEWKKACRGPEGKGWSYGDRREVGRCNDNGRSPVVALFGHRFNAATMNKASLNQLEGTLAKTGEHRGCTNGYGVYDMVGNLHEWVADPSGTFYGGYYQDVSSIGHGEGCDYVTTAHQASYHDYSTGFRCCADLPQTR